MIWTRNETYKAAHEEAVVGKVRLERSAVDESGAVDTLGLETAVEASVGVGCAETEVSFQ